MLYKVLNELPTELEKDSLYFVQKNDGFDLYVTNHYGAVVQAYPLNRPEVIPVTKVISSNDQETFFNIDLNEKKTFEWSIEVFESDRIQTRKIMAVLNESELEGTEFAIVGHQFNIEVEVIKDGDMCRLDLYNNESFDLTASIRLL